jgi:hypothetical protein
MLQLRSNFTNKPYALTWQRKRQKQIWDRVARERQGCPCLSLYLFSKMVNPKKKIAGILPCLKEQNKPTQIGK